MSKKKKYYVVWEGHEPGVYDTWPAAQRQTKNYPNAKYKSFPSKQAAEAAFHSDYRQHMNYGGGSKKAGGAKPTIDTISSSERQRIVWDSIAVDAACSGNPGKTEYQGVDTKTGARIFYKNLNLGTNNIGEFLALVHALAYFDQRKLSTPIYTDSRTAMAWVRNKKVKTTLKRNRSTEELYQLIGRAEQWLKTHTWNNPILKWETEKWGEIPADFGRK